MNAVGIALGLMLAQAGGAPAAAAPVLTLEEVLRDAQARNLDLKAARARLDQARQTSWKALSYYLPQLNAGGTYTHNDFRDVILELPPSLGGPVTIQKQDQLGAQVQLNQALIAPALWPAIRNAYRAEDLAAVTVEGARRDILFGAAQLYYGAAGLKQAVEVQQQVLDVAMRHEKDAKVRYDAGTTPKVALLRAQIDRARAEEDLRRAQNAYASAKVSLATLLARDESRFEVTRPAEPVLPADMSSLEATALRERPDVQAATLGVALAETNKTASWMKYLPSLAAFGRYQWANVTGFTGKETTWAVGLGVNWALFDGGLREAELRENSAKIVEADANRLAAEARARDEVRRGLLDLESARANRAKADEQRRLAQENEALIQVNYRAGAATQIEVSDATTALQSAELGLVAESLNADLAALRVLKAAGEFNPK